jgi:hypothetical protein
MAVALYVHEHDRDGLARAFALARDLPAHLGAAIFCRDPYSEAMDRHVPGVQLEDARTLAFELRMYASRTKPAVIVSVDHPAPCDVGPDIQQFVLGPDVPKPAASAFVNALVTKACERTAAAAVDPVRHGGATHDSRTTRRRFAIRVDDVTEVSDELLAICELCAARHLRASLEVIPYLCQIDEETLRRVTPEGFDFEVSQHGFAHLPRRCGGRKTEFVSAAGWRDVLERSSQRMAERFPTTFTFGFSAPYDFYPPGLTQLWADVGGKYVSVIWAAVDDPVPVVRLTDDPWDWSRHAPRPIAAVVENVERSFARSGSAGLVLHPQPLSVPGERERLGDLLDAIVDGSCEPWLLSELAVNPLPPPSS